MYYYEPAVCKRIRAVILIFMVHILHLITLLMFRNKFIKSSRVNIVYELSHEQYLVITKPQARVFSKCNGTIIIVIANVNAFPVINTN